MKPIIPSKEIVRGIKACGKAIKVTGGQTVILAPSAHQPRDRAKPTGREGKWII